MATTPVSPIRPSIPVVGFVRRALIAMVTAKTKKPALTRTAGMMTLREILIYSAGLSMSMREPRKSEMTPPTASNPWLTTLISAMKRMIGKKNQGQPRKVDGKHLERVESEDQKDSADDSRKDGSGIGEFKEDPVDPQHQKDVGDRGVGNDIQKLVAPAHLNGSRYAFGLKGPGHRRPT